MLKKFSEIYTSNTTAGCANQHYFLTDGKRRLSRAYFKISVGGRYNYSLLFSGILDGSYRRISFHDEECAGWTIHSARVGKLAAFRDGSPAAEPKREDELPTKWLAELTFSGNREITVPPALFSSDEVELSFLDGEYLALELEYSGEKIPCHPEIAIPVYTKVGELWEYSVNMPLPCMIGCDRPVKERITYLGDSITQGADMDVNCYGHWMAKFSEKLPKSYSHWNLGIGLGKISDVSCKGVWYKKGECGDTVFVCYGVNDVNSDKSAELITAQIYDTVSGLKALGKRVIVQTVPPFDYPEKRRAEWEKVNTYILNELRNIADAVFDPNFILEKSKDEPHIAKYGGHPSEEGCILWADALFRAVGHLFPE